MSKFKIQLRGIQSNLFSFGMVFFSTLLVIIVLIVNFSFEKSVVGARIDQLRAVFLNTPILVMVADAEANRAAYSIADQAVRQIDQMASDGTNSTMEDEGQEANQTIVTGNTFETDQAKDILSRNDNILGWVESYSFSAGITLGEPAYVAVYGMDMGQQSEIYDMQLVEGSLDFAEKNGVVVSESFARDNALKMGDTFKVYLNPVGWRETGTTIAQRIITHAMSVVGISDTSMNAGSGANAQGGGSQQGQDGGQEQTDQGVEVVIKGIAPDTGFFLQMQYDLQQDMVISKLDFAQEVHKKPDKVNSINVAIKDMSSISQTLDELNGSLQDINLVAGQRYDDEYYNSYVSTVVLALNLFVGFMVLVSLYIILTVFRSYVYQNMYEMMTLRSIGFTIKRYRFLVMGQVGLIVLVAAGMGLAASVPCTRLLWSMALEEESGLIELNWVAAFLVMAGALGVATLSAWLATKKVSKTPIVAILKKNVVQKEGRVRGVQCVLGVLMEALAVGALVLRAYVPSLGVVPYFVAIGLALVGFILLHDAVVNGFSWLIKVLFGRKGHALGLFAKQLKFNCASYTQSISILSLVILVSAMVVSISSMLDKALMGVYRGADLGVVISSESYDSGVTALDNTQVSYLMQKKQRVTVEEKNVEISGIPVDQYIQKDYERVKNGTREEVFGGLRTPGTVVVTTTFTQTSDKDVGDRVRIEGKDYTIMGVVSSFENMGQIMFVSDATFNDMFEKSAYTLLALVDTGTAEDTQALIEKELAAQGVSNYFVTSIQEMREDDARSSQQIITIIYFLCGFSLLVSGISMVSNLIVNMISRRSDFLIYRTTGVPKEKIRKTVLYEALSMGVYSGVTGIGMGCILLPILASVLSYYVGAIEYDYNFPLLGALLGIACVISIFSVLFTIQKYVFKTNLIEEIKRV